MARKVEYYCDECKSLFGDAPHINIKSGDIRLSYLNPAMPGGARWVQKRFVVPNHELHFCNGECLGKFFAAHYNDLKKKIEDIINKEPPEPASY